MGVSGGPDSMALLDMLRKEGYHLIACLVNYHKRNDSDLDYEVVKDYCDKYQIPLTYKEIFHYEKGNFQSQARIMRYDFYEEVCHIYHCDGVLLAHHFDDFLETVLMQEDRNGLWGIAETSVYQSIPVYRPALNYTKQELLEYCENEGIDYRIDSSNLETDYTRNKIRHHVLSQYTYEDKQKLYQKALLHNQEYIKRCDYCEAFLNGRTQISLKELKESKYQEEILDYYLRTFEGMDVHRISKRLVQNCLQSLLGKDGNMQIPLPVDFVLIKEYDNVYVTKIKDVSGYYYEITKSEAKDYGCFKISFDGNDRCGICVKDDDWPLVIRTFRQGDSISLSYGTKKLSRLFIDAKIPRHQRDLWPIVLNRHNEIILVPKIAKNKAYLLEKPTWFVLQ